LELGSFFKFPFYRLFFSLVVGIIALESLVLSWNFKHSTPNSSVIDGVLLRIEKPTEPYNIPTLSTIEIPFKVIRIMNTRNHQTAIVFRPVNKIRETKNPPKIIFRTGAYLKGDPTIEIKAIPDLIIDKTWIIFKIKTWNLYSLVIYLMLAALVGELLCSVGDILLGILFCFNPLSCSPYIEKCSPFNKSLIRISEVKDLSKEFLEFSELHFILSRTFSGLVILSFLLILQLFSEIRESILPTTILLLALTLIAIIYRIQANRIIKQGSKNC